MVSTPPVHLFRFFSFSKWSTKRVAPSWRTWSDRDIFAPQCAESSAEAGVAEVIVDLPCPFRTGHFVAPGHLVDRFTGGIGERGTLVGHRDMSRLPGLAQSKRYHGDDKIGY